jgi:hypothetical protein
MNNRITSYWDDNLLKVSSSRLQETNLPEHTNQFLQDVGIPTILAQDLFAEFLNEVQPVQRMITSQTEHFILLGELEFGSKLCVKEGTGELYSFTPLNSIVFVNSSIHAFVTILTIYREFLDNYEDELLKTQIQEITQQMIASDPLAFHDEASWWNTVLEDLSLALTDYSIQHVE